jgi:hypothetical protein
LVLSSQGHGWEWGRYLTQGYFGGTSKPRAQTYDELLADDGLDYGERLKLRGEATISLAAHLLIGRGHDKIVGLLPLPKRHGRASSSPTGDLVNRAADWAGEGPGRALAVVVGHENERRRIVTGAIRLPGKGEA